VGEFICGSVALWTMKAVVHRLDTEGKLPLHMAAASGNIVMFRELVQRFSGVASVLNHNGLLPLHLEVMLGAMSPTGINVLILQAQRG